MWRLATKVAWLIGLLTLTMRCGSISVCLELALLMPTLAGRCCWEVVDVGGLSQLDRLRSKRAL